MAEDKFTNINQDIANFDNLTKFDSFIINRYIDGFITGYSFVFVTKPSLFIYPYKPPVNNRELMLAYENMTKDQLFSQFLAEDSLNRNDRIISEQLSFYEGIFPSNYTRQNFMPLFTNKSKAFNTSDTVMEQQEVFVTKQGFRMPLPTFKTPSEANGTLAIPMNETPNLDITKTLSLWVNYISNVTDGTFNANPTMVKNGVIDYMSSIYYFVLEPDGKTVKYWAKYTGCWPNQIPYSQMSYRRGESTIVEVEANFVYTNKEEMNVAILEDFNRVSLDFISTGREEIDAEYLSPKKSLFLSKERIKNIANYSPESRSPLVFYKQGRSEKSTNPDDLNDKFELTFGIDVYSDTFVDSKFTEDYFFNTKEFFTSKLDEEE
jgi:hypothetical protein